MSTAALPRPQGAEIMVDLSQVLTRQQNAGLRDRSARPVPRRFMPVGRCQQRIANTEM